MPGGIYCFVAEKVYFDMKNDDAIFNVTNAELVGIKVRYSEIHVALFMQRYLQ